MVFPLPSSIQLHVHELKVLLSFRKITSLCTCTVPWIFVCDQCGQYFALCLYRMIFPYNGFCIQYTK